MQQSKKFHGWFCPTYIDTVTRAYVCRGKSRKVGRFLNVYYSVPGGGTSIGQVPMRGVLIFFLFRWSDGAVDCRVSGVCLRLLCIGQAFTRSLIRSARMHFTELDIGSRSLRFILHETSFQEHLHKCINENRHHIMNVIFHTSFWEKLIQ